MNDAFDSPDAYEVLIEDIRRALAVLGEPEGHEAPLRHLIEHCRKMVSDWDADSARESADTAGQCATSVSGSSTHCT